MSTISSDIIRARTAGLETPAIYPVRGSAKSWINFDGTGTVSIRDSLNISGLIDNNTGNYSPSFNNSFSAANYSFGSAGSVGLVSGVGRIINVPTATYTNTDFTCQTSLTTTAVDLAYINIEAFGNLA